MLYTTINGNKTRPVTGWIEQTQLDKNIEVDQDLFDDLWSLHPSERAECIFFGKVTQCPGGKRVMVETIFLVVRYIYQKN